MSDPVHTWRGQGLDRPLPGCHPAPARLWEQARRRPGAPFVTEVRSGRDHTTVTYGEMADRVARRAGRLAARLDLRPGARVAVTMANDTRSVEDLLALGVLGATGVLLSPFDPAARRRRQVEAMGCVAVLPDDVPPGPADPVERTAPDSHAVAQVVFTTGSTSTPKGVAQTHYAIAVNAEALRRHHGIVAGDTLLGCLPLHHVNGLNFTVVTTLAAGAHLVLCDRFDPRRWAATAAAARPRIASLVPSMLDALADLRSPPDLSHLDHVVSAAAPLRQRTAAAATSRLGVRVVQGYGLSETTNFSTTMPVGLDDADYRGLVLDRVVSPVGVALFGNEVAVVGDDGAPCRPGEEGEVCMRGHSVMAGYVDDPDATGAAFAGGWFHSGDVGRLEDHAAGPLLTLLGRRKHVVKVAGEGISLDELERTVLQVPGVVDAACVGVEDAVLGEVPVAFVVTREPVAERAVRDAVALAMPPAAQPRTISFVGSLPRLPNGKVDRRRLAAGPA